MADTTLTAGSGTFALTGYDVTFTKALTMTAGAGSLALTFGYVETHYIAVGCQFTGSWNDLRAWDDSLYWVDAADDLAEPTTTTVAKEPPRPAVHLAYKSDNDGLTTVPISVSVTEDTELTDIIPAGYYLDKIIVSNNTSGTCVLDIGTTSEGAEIVDDLSIGANSYTTVSAELYFGYSASTTLYINNFSATGSPSLDLAFVCIRLYKT